MIFQRQKNPPLRRVRTVRQKRTPGTGESFLRNDYGISSGATVMLPVTVAELVTLTRI